MNPITSETGPHLACLATRLRAETRDLHTRAERHPVQASLVRGMASTGDYIAYLQQIRHIHAVLEAELAERVGDPALAPVHPSQFRASRAEADLADLGACGDVGPTPPVERFAREVGALSSPELLGMQYVLEGSTNGGKFIARAVSRALPASAGAATRYLDPHGEQQTERWAGFCRALTELRLRETEQAQVVRGAEAMFRLIIDMFDAIGSAGAPACAS